MVYSHHRNLALTALWIDMHLMWLNECWCMVDYNSPMRDSKIASELGFLLRLCNIVFKPNLIFEPLCTLLCYVLSTYCVLCMCEN